MSWKSRLTPLLPPAPRRVLETLPEDTSLLELRLRVGQPMELVYPERSRLIFSQNGAPMLTEEDCPALLSAICGRSIYAWEEELREGFVTLGGGCRVGLCGRAVVEDGRVLRFSSVTGFNFRIARQCLGVAEPLLPALTCDGRLLPTLVVSPPGCGKTTLLRDLVRLASRGTKGLRPARVGVTDERFELAGGADGEAFDLGPRCDVMSGLPKAEGLRRLIAALSPQVLACDELNSKAEAEAVLAARSCGVVVLATAHADSVQGLLRRPAFQLLWEEKVFARVVLLQGVGLPPRVIDVTGDGEG